MKIIRDTTGGTVLPFIQRSSSPSLYATGLTCSPLKVVDMLAYVVRGESASCKSPSKSKRESASFIAQRKWKTKPIKRASPNATPTELYVCKLNKRTQERTFPQRRSKALSTVDTYLTRKDLQPPCDFTKTSMVKVSRSEADEIVKELLQHKHSRHRRMLNSLEFKAPPKRKTATGILHKHVQSNDYFE